MCVGNLNGQASVYCLERGCVATPTRCPGSLPGVRYSRVIVSSRFSTKLAIIV